MALRETPAARRGPPLPPFVPAWTATELFVQNSAHMSVRVLNNITSAHPVMGGIVNGSTETDIYPKYSDGNSYFRIQGAGASGFANASSIGDYMAIRSSSGAGVDAYKDNSFVGNTSGASQPVLTGNIVVLGVTNNITGVAGSAFQVARFSIGNGSWSSTDRTNFRNLNLTLEALLGIP